MAHTYGKEEHHNRAGREETHLVAEKQAGEDLVGSSEKEYKGSLQDDELMKIDVEVAGELENTVAEE